MPTIRAWWWWLRRCCVAWVCDHWSNGSTIVSVWLNGWRAVVPRRWPWWRWRETVANACARRADAHADRRVGLSAVEGDVVSFKHMLVQTFISLDQTANVLLSWLSPWAWRGAWADETLSSRAYRAWRDGAPFGRVAMPVIDFLFRWQTIRPDAIGHCHQAYLRERERYNSHPEMR